MVIQVVNFNLEGIGHQDYLGATVDVAPAFNDVKGLNQKYGYPMKQITCTEVYILGRIVRRWRII